MINVGIVTDTSACIPRQLAEKYAIEQVPLAIIFGDKVYRDGIDITPAEFYHRLRQAEKLPTTASSSPESFLEVYRQASQRASGLLCITPPARFSGTFNSAALAAQMAEETLPGVVVRVTECSTAAAAQGLVVLAAARAAAAGGSLDEVTGTVARLMPRVNLLATLESLQYLVKGGRVPKVAALAGSLFKIKPIFTVSQGDAQLLATARTVPGAVQRILKMMAEKIVEGQPLRVAVVHADALDRAIALRDRISSQFDCTELFITEFTPVMGVHTGSGVIGVAFYSGD